MSDIFVGRAERTRYEPEDFERYTSIALIVPLMVWRAWAFVTLWTWFAVPLGAIALSVPVVIGLSALASALRMKITWPETRDEWIERTFLLPIVAPAVALLTGLVARSFL